MEKANGGIHRGEKTEAQKQEESIVCVTVFAGEPAEHLERTLRTDGQGFNACSISLCLFLTCFGGIKE